MSPSKVWCLPHLRKLAVLGLIGAGAILISVAVAHDRKHRRRRKSNAEQQSHKADESVDTLSEEAEETQHLDETDSAQQAAADSFQPNFTGVDSTTTSSPIEMKEKCNEIKASCEESSMTTSSRPWRQSPSVWMERINDSNNDASVIVQESSAVESRVRNLTSDSGVVSPAVAELNKVALMSSPEEDTLAAEDAGLGTDIMAQMNNEEEQGASSTEHQNGEKALSDSGQGSEPDDRTVVSYVFRVPSRYCGMLIGAKGVFVNQLRKASECDVFVSKVHRRNGPTKKGAKENYETCLLQGTRASIEKCLELIRKHMPLSKYPELTLEQESVSAAAHLEPYLMEGSMQATNSPQMTFISGEVTDVLVTAVISASHVFVQHPSHSSWSELSRLSECMHCAYNELNAPVMMSMPEVGTVCVAPYDQSWVRVQVVQAYAESESCDVKFVDYGGFAHYLVSDLRKIRSDFMLLPFQATECYIANIAPLDGIDFPPEATDCLQELLSNQVCCARVLGFATDCVPMVTLEVQVSKEMMLNVSRELVDRGFAAWVEHQAIDANQSVDPSENVAMMAQLSLQSLEQPLMTSTTSSTPDMTQEVM